MAKVEKKLKALSEKQKVEMLQAMYLDIFTFADILLLTETCDNWFFS